MHACINANIYNLYIYFDVTVYIYIYIYRERERERCIHTHTHTHTHIYILHECLNVFAHCVLTSKFFNVIIEWIQ